MDRGWIKIYRSLLDWEWFDDAETVRLFVYILLSANYEDKKWRGMEVKRGQYVTSVGSLSDILGLSVKKVRIRLQRLSDSGAITTSGANRFTIITICNYDTYQAEEAEKDALRANRGRAKGEQKGEQRASKRANEFNTLTPYDCDTYECPDDDKGQAKGRAKGEQRVPKRATTKEDKKIRSLSEEEVAKATSEKAAAKNAESEGRKDSGEDTKPIDAPKTPIEASVETFEGGVDKIYPENEKTRQNANFCASLKSNNHTPETAPADQAPRPVSNRVRKEDEEEIPPTPPKEEEEEKRLRENVVANATTSKSAEQSDETDAEAETKILYKHIIEAWNEETKGALGKLMMITGRRREMVRARIRETSVDDFFTMIHNAASSSFLRGESQRGWVANFDWCIRPNNYPKVLEGRYNDHEGEGVILPPNAKRVTDSSEGVDYRYIDFRELDKQHRR